MPNQTPHLLSELNNLLRLTQTETQVAQLRRAQAASDDVDTELARNADRADRRTRLLAEAIRALDGFPDVVGVAVGRVAAVTKGALDQGQTLSDALLGDLALEHELLARTKFAKMLADQVDTPAKVTDVLDRLEDAHTDGIEWLMTRLAEVALGGPVALRPTPTQAVVGVARQVASFPVRQTAGSVNRSVAAVGDFQARAEETVSVNLDRARQLVDAAGEIWSAGRDASLERTEEIARQRNDGDTARSVHRVREDLGAVDADELPIRNYDDLNAPQITGRIERLTDPQEVRTVLAYEAANKARKGVTTAAAERLEELAEAMATAS